VYRTGSTTTIAATPSQAKRRFVASIEVRNAARVTPAQNSPKNPASSSAFGNRALAAWA
jgi:hypothetical protein